MNTDIVIGNKVKMLREKSALNQTQIAKFLGVDQSYISKCEKGERQFNVDSLEKLCNLFGCMLSDLMNIDQPVTTINFAFRADAIENEDLIAISDINKIALNMIQMRKLLEA
jgi:transcriptional regulator with XRE-family HTH domain